MTAAYGYTNQRELVVREIAEEEEARLAQEPRRPRYTPEEFRARWRANFKDDEGES